LRDSGISGEFAEGLEGGFGFALLDEGEIGLQASGVADGRRAVEDEQYVWFELREHVEDRERFVGLLFVKQEARRKELVVILELLEGLQVIEMFFENCKLRGRDRTGLEVQESQSLNVVRVVGGGADFVGREGEEVFSR
jgi:hypothetical protein